MKLLCFGTLLLLTSCQQSNQSGIGPQSSTGTGARVKYRLVTIHGKNRDYGASDYPLLLQDFETEVNQAIAEGWQPVGGVAAASAFGIPIQAMMKAE